MNFIQFPGAEAVKELVYRLEPAASAQWGIMSAQHMLEHLILPLHISRGLLHVPLATPFEKLEKVKRIMLLSDAPLKKDFAAPFLGSGLQPLQFASFELAQMGLMNEIDLFLAHMEKHPDAVFTHPVFGPLTREEWFLFHRKHFTHHFSQFGLIQN